MDKNNNKEKGAKKKKKKSKENNQTTSFKTFINASWKSVLNKSSISYQTLTICMSNVVIFDFVSRSDFFFAFISEGITSQSFEPTKDIVLVQL